MASNINLRIRLAYLEFKRRFIIVSSLYVIAMLLGFTLFVYSELVYSNAVLKWWSIFLVILLFTKVFFDFWSAAKKEYTVKFQQQA